MTRRSKCKYCNEFIDQEFLLTKIEIINNKEKKIKLHKQCEEDYNELMEYKENELKWFNELYNNVKSILGYSEEQKLPSYLITRLQDLRNGTIVQRGIGRVVKSKEGYTYEIILDTFLSQSERIEWSFKNKIFENEKNRINYMMAIVENNINDNYIYFKEKNNSNVVKERINLIEEDKFIHENKTNMNNKEDIIHSKKGISKFLDDDDF